MTYSATEIQHFSTPEKAANWLRSRGVNELCSDSRRVHQGDAFIAWPGFVQDSRIHIPHAFKAGAVACLVEQEGVADALTRWPFLPEIDTSAIACVSGLKAMAGEIAAAFYEHPSQKLSVVAITGTNGKTSSAWWIAQALTGVGQTAGVIGTLGVGLPCSDSWQQTGLTTPDPVAIQHHLSVWLSQGVRACAIEASSIGIAEQRLSGLAVRVAVFTNFTQDHLDYHKTMEAYWAAKRRLFDLSSVESVVINIDNAHGQQLANELRQSQKKRTIWTYSLNSAAANLIATEWSPTVTGFELTVKDTHTREQMALSVPFVGAYNVSNLLGVICTLRAHNLSLADAVRACHVLTAVPGRMQVVQRSHDSNDTSKQTYPLVLVDYAHTPDALVQAITALRPIVDLRKGRLHVVVGCGGDRDRLKRPLMARAAEQYADCIWLTSDNPRSEDPSEILQQMVAGLSHPDASHVIADRSEAIKAAIFAASSQDVILIAGKGHEVTQEIKGVKHPFSDVVQAQQALFRS